MSLAIGGEEPQSGLLDDEHAVLEAKHSRDGPQAIRD